LSQIFMYERGKKQNLYNCMKKQKKILRILNLNFRDIKFETVKV